MADSSELHDAAEQDKVRHLLTKVIEQLPEQDRGILQMHYGDRMSPEQMAQKLNLAPATVVEHLKQAEETCYSMLSVKIGTLLDQSWLAPSIELADLWENEPTSTVSLVMDGVTIPLTQETATLIRQRMMHGAYDSPEPVIRKALHALQELEPMQHFPKNAPLTSEPERQDPIPILPPEESPLVQWLQETAKPSVGLEKVRDLLSGIPDTLSETICEEREDRF